MSNVLSVEQSTRKKIKQFLSIALAFTTTVSLSGFALVFAFTAHAQVASLADGDLVRGPDGIKVYIVKPLTHGSFTGWKRHIFNPTVFDMYGHLLWSDIKSVNQATLDAYQNSDLYSAVGDEKVYSLVEAGSTATKHWIENEAAFLAGGYSWDQIFTVIEVERDFYASGAMITTSSPSPTPTPTPTPSVGSGLGVSLASDTPASDSVLSHSAINRYPQALIPFTKLNFSAGSDGDVTITSLKMKRTGIASDSDFGNLYLYDGDTKLAEFASFNDKVVTFTNSAGLFTVAKGTTRMITLKGDLARGNPSVSASKTMGFDLMSSADVVAGGATVTGSFPMTGNRMTTASVNDLGNIYFSAYNTFPATIKGDAVNQELWRFNLVSDAQDMEIRRLKLTLVGTIAVTDITNLRLEISGVQAGSAVSIASDRSVTFDLASAPAKMIAGQTKTVILRGDMAGGADRAFKFTIQRSADVSVYDTEYGVFVTPAKDSLTGVFAIIQPTTAAGTSVDVGTLTLGVSPDSPTGNTADAATALTLGKFSFQASGEAVKVDTLTVGCTSVPSGRLLSNVKLLLDGSQVGTTNSSITCGSSESFSFGNTFVIPAASTRNLDVVVDTTDASVVVGDTIVITLAVGSGNAQGQTTLTSISTTAQSSRTLTIQSGTATVVKNSSFGDKSSTNPTGTVNATAVKIGSFIITAGSGEAITVTQIGLADDATTQLGDNFQNLKVMNGTSQIGSTITSLNTTAGTYSFTPASAISVLAGQQYVVDVYADIKSTVADSATSLVPTVVFDSVTATGVSTSASASYTTNVNLQTGYLSTNGNLTITKGADTPDAAQLVMGATDVSLATFKFEADAAEDINITELIVSDSVSSAATGTIKNLKLFVDGLQVGQTVQLDTTNATTTYAHAKFANISLIIPRNQNKTVTIKGDISTFDDGAVTASTHTFGILVDNNIASTESVDAKGVSSGTTITGANLDYGTSPDVDLTGEQMTAYRTVLTVAYASDTPSGVVLTGSADQQVAKINITNSANTGNYAATVKAMNFVISSLGTSKPAATARNLKIYKSSVTTNNKVATYTWAAADNVNYSDTAITNGTSNLTSFVDTEIAAGSTKLFIVTLDTNDATTATDSISIGMDASDLTWRDQSTGSDISASDSLPLLTKTLTR